MATPIPYRLPSHIQKIQSLYKRYIRNLESWYMHRNVFRYYAVIARQDFDKLLNEKDMIKAKEMLEKKEEELFLQRHYQPKKFPKSPGGTAYERDFESPDWVLDYWHPLEKAHYPEYFARRELRKRQFIEMWEKQYGPPPKDHHH